MSILPIRLYPDPVLRVECAPVSTFDDDLEKLVVDMIETLHDANGVGLAAPQIGLETQLAVVDTSDGSRREDAVVLVNPEILEADGRDDDIEGCLSIPGIVEKVRRPFELRVRAQDATGRTYELEAEGRSREVADKLIDFVERIVAESPGKFAIARSPADLEQHFEAGIISLPLGMENGSPIEGDLENLRYFYDRGVRYITLAHGLSNHISDSSYDDNKQWGGLSDFGKAVVQEMKLLLIWIEL